MLKFLENFCSHTPDRSYSIYFSLSFEAVMFQGFCSWLCSSTVPAGLHVQFPEWRWHSAVLSSVHHFPFLQLTQPDRDLGTKLSSCLYCSSLWGSYLCLISYIFLFTLWTQVLVCCSFSVWEIQISFTSNVLWCYQFFSVIILFSWAICEFECDFMQWSCLLMFGLICGAHSNLSLFS